MSPGYWELLPTGYGFGKHLSHPKDVRASRSISFQGAGDLQHWKEPPVPSCILAGGIGAVYGTPSAIWSIRDLQALLLKQRDITMSTCTLHRVMHHLDFRYPRHDPQHR